MDKILAVDDDKLFLEALKRGLKKYESQFQSFFASSVDGAIEIMKKERIAVLVTDIVMPGKGGLDLFAYKDRFHPRTQCIVMTGYGTDDLRDSADIDDAFCLLEKPFPISDLGRAVMQALIAKDEGNMGRPILLSTLLKLIKAKKETCILELESVHGKKGRLYFINGGLSGAEQGEQNGGQAARNILAWDRVHFSFQKIPQEILTDLVDKSHDFHFPNAIIRKTVESSIFEVNPPVRSPSDGMLNVLIVDDSKLMRKVIADILTSHDGIRIVGECQNGIEALETVKKTKVDLITLDVEMPEMDGLTTLKHLMIKYPTPVVMVSSLTQEGASITFEALKLGAVDFVAKPSRLTTADMTSQSSEIVRKVTLAANVEISKLQLIRGVTRDGNQKKCEVPGSDALNRIFVIGAAEGGYGALLKIVPHLTDPFNGACIVMLHAESKYVDAFVEFLEAQSRLHIKRAVNGIPIQNGCCYIASGDDYLSIEENTGIIQLQVTPAPSFHTRSNINIMMFSAAETLPLHTTGIILSGMGADGCEGMAEIRRVGGQTIVQSPESCSYKEMATTVLRESKDHKVFRDAEIADEMIRSVNLRTDFGCMNNPRRFELNNR